ncbi:MAG: 6-phosphofructokinase [Nitrososphaerota archaeon]|nr:6-phosphofructokinase [Nitrososphaerota archaeon]MDG7027958.1 6-phosphofructokinase [Nitrososphaerota archaeon]
MKIGILSGGGDCGGINALIRAAVHQGEKYGYEMTGIRRGWAGLVEPDTVSLTYEDVEDIVSEGGTILLTSRTNPYKKEGGPELVMKNVEKLGLDALLVIGGEDTQGVAHRLASAGLKFVAAPKTMDNDLSETDVTFGFDSAVNVAVEAIDRVRTTGESHERVMVVEVMGRDAGWVAVHAGIACGAHVVLAPEEPVDLDEVCSVLERRKRAGKKFSLIVAAEGARLANASQSTVGQKLDQFGHPVLRGIGALLASEVTERTGLEAREVVLGHLVRGGPPSAFDRVYATRLGAAAVDLIREGKSDVMVALHGDEVIQVPVEKALKPRKVSLSLLKLAQSFGR